LEQRDFKPVGIIEIPERPTNCTFGPTRSQTLSITARTSLHTVKLTVDSRR
jgi:sugar lactone lactonase YvrE